LYFKNFYTMLRVPPKYESIAHNRMKVGMVNHLECFLWHKRLNCSHRFLTSQGTVFHIRTLQLIFALYCTLFNSWYVYFITWLRGLRHEPSSPARTLESWVRIPLKVSLLRLCVVLCVGSGLVTGWSPVHGVLPTVYRIRKLKYRSRPTMVVET
jgi:hypothetical protein